MSVQGERFIYESKFLDVCLKNAASVIIYGIGVYGSTVVDYMIKTGNKEKIRGIVVTDRKDAHATYENIPISDAKSCFRNEENRNCLVIVAVSMQFQESIVAVLESFGINRWYCLTRHAYLNLMKNGDKRLRIPYRGVDFLIAGFIKCGTTSLHSVLRKVDSVFVPLEKETHFFWWFDKVDNAEEKLIERYFSDIRKGQEVIGAVDPTFYSYADEIYRHFGPAVRLVFVMRNPAEAAFSLYKMENRGGNPIFEDMYRKYGEYHEKMFEHYFENIIKNEKYPFHYDYWLQKFYKLFPKDQIHIVFFEDMAKFPEREISNILEFIGTNEKHVISELPRANEGNFVLKNLEGYRIAKQRGELQYVLNYSFSDEKTIGGGYDADRFMELERKFAKTDKLNVKPGKKEQDMLKQYFYADIRNLENILNRDLSEVWF